VGTLDEDQYKVLIIFCSVLLRIEMFQTKAVQKIKTNILCSINFSKIMPFMG